MKLIQHIPKEGSKICIVGEAPGVDEDRTGVPFIGWEGQYLRKQLKAAGINFNSCYVTNTVHKRPFKNNYNTLSASTISEGIRQLKEDLESWKSSGLNVVIAVGAEALKALTGKSQITRYRGSVMESSLVPGLKVVATIHPGGILRGGEKMGRYEPIQILDFKKALRESAYPDIVELQHNIEIVKSPDRAIKLLTDLVDKPEPVVVDIETIGPIMSAYGVATSKNEAFSIVKDLMKDPNVLRTISKFAISSTPKIFHNALFDCLHNAYYYKIINKNILDTMLAQHAIYPTLPKSLGFCASIYTNAVYWKDEGKNLFDEIKKGHTINWDDLYIYNGKDCCLTYEVYEKQQEELSAWHTNDSYDLMLKLIHPCMFAMIKGTKIDRFTIDKFKDHNERVIELLDRIIHSTLGDINVNSHVQLKELIYNQWDMPKQYLGKKVTVSDKKLALLERFPTPYQPYFGLFRTYKKHLKKRDFYTLKINEDGRIRTSLKVHGTYTGRFASSESIFGSGKNLLNIPKETRTFYVADKGHIFIQGDLSQAEARIVAALCGDKEWLQKFSEIDVHREVAAALFRVSYDDVTSSQRTVAKRVSHATHYGLGKILLSEILGCPPKEAQAHKDAYYAIRPYLHLWQESVKNQIRSTRLIRTIFGRSIQFLGPITDKMFRDAIAAEPQSTSADYLNHGLVRIYEKNLPTWEFRLSVYDSILCQVEDDIDTVLETINIMRRLVEFPITINNLTFTIPMDFEIGYSWGSLIEVKTEDDIRNAYNRLHEIL